MLFFRSRSRFRVLGGPFSCGLPLGLGLGRPGFPFLRGLLDKLGFSALCRRSGGQHRFKLGIGQRRLYRYHRGIGLRQDLDTLRRLKVSHVERLVDLERGDIDLDGTRDLVRETLHFNLAQPVLENTALLHARGSPGNVQGDGHPHFFVQRDLHEVDVEKPSGYGIELIVFDQSHLVGPFFCPLKLEADEGMLAALGVQYLRHLLAAHRDRERLPDPVEDRGDHLAPAQTAGHSFSRSFPHLGCYRYLFHFSSNTILMKRYREPLINTDSFTAMSHELSAMSRPYITQTAS